MRKSVERRQRQQQQTPAKRPGFWRRHIVLVVALPLLAIAGVGSQYYLHTSAAAAAVSRSTTQAQRLATVDTETKKAIQKKIDDAKKAEAEAKAKAAEEEAKRKAEATAKPAGTVAAPANCGTANPDSITVVINKKHCFSPLSWAPGDLTSVNGYLMRTEAAGQMINMMNAAAAAGLGFDLSSAYRSYTDQATVYNYWVSVNGSQAAADTVSARAGYSEHQTGLAADLKVGGCALECFAGSAQYTWLTQHAAEYGFIQRYPVGLTSITGYSPEAWHWRYVGVATATDMKQKGIQTLEQYLGISGGDYN